MTYAHHGQIRCYTFTRSTHGPVQRWDAYCACGWRTENQPDWPCAYWRLLDHQTDLEPRWIVYTHRTTRAPETIRGIRDEITERPLQRAHRPNGARA